jgi:flavoprotein
VVDRLSDDSATIEVDSATSMTVPVWMLPQDVVEGDVLRIKHDRRTDRSIFMIVSDDDERRRRLIRSERQVAVRSQNDRPGDIVL